MSSKRYSLIEVAEEFDIDFETIKSTIVLEDNDNKTLSSDEFLSEENYGLLESHFASNLAERRIRNCIDSKSSYLNLSNCALNNDDFLRDGILHDLFKQCSHLETLILSARYLDYDEDYLVESPNRLAENFFYEIPEPILFCKNLKKLILSGYANNAYRLWTIKDVNSLSNLQSLTYLDVSGNEIENIEVLNKLKDLNTIVLSDNQLKKVSALSNLSNLKSLYLSNNHLEDLDGLQYLKSLRHLELSGNIIGTNSGNTKHPISWNKKY